MTSRVGGGSLADYRYHTFCAGVRAVLLRWPGSVTSWWRTPARNRAVGSTSQASQHLAGTAVDVIFDHQDEIQEDLLVATAREHGLEAIKEGDHWHLELATLLD